MMDRGMPLGNDFMGRLPLFSLAERDRVVMARALSFLPGHDATETACVAHTYLADPGLTFFSPLCRPVSLSSRYR
jgi:hypothetical protein